MKKTAFVLFVMVSLALVSAGLAADKTFRAVGKVTQSTPTMIKVRTTMQDLEIARDKNTKVVGDLKKNAHVTVIYTKVNGLPQAIEVDVNAK